MNQNHIPSSSQEEGSHKSVLPVFVKRAILLGGFLTFFVVPIAAEAGFFSIFSDLFNKPPEVTTENKSVNAQNMNLLQAAVNSDPNPAKGGGDITVVSGSALLSEDGPEGTALDVEEKTATGHISLYVVRPGDNLSSIAKLFGVSKNTVLWANDVSGGVIKPGQTLIILPISGVQHTVAKGDTIKSIAKKYRADEKEILQYNGLEEGATLALGDFIMVPDGEIAPLVRIPSVTSPWRRSVGGPRIDGYYLRPIIGGVRTQGLHGYNGVDLASYRGAPILASAIGIVIISRTSGWNAGYGQYIVLQHENGTQTLYAHLSKSLVSPGERVVQGEVIGEMGATGKATGVHLHFEVRSAANPF